MGTTWPDTKHPARVLGVIHSSFPFLPMPNPSSRTILLPNIHFESVSTFHLHCSHLIQVTSIPHLGCSNTFPTASPFTPLLSISTQQPEGFCKPDLITCISPCLNPSSGFSLHLEWNADSFPWPTKPPCSAPYPFVSPSFLCAPASQPATHQALPAFSSCSPGGSSFFRFQPKWYLLIETDHFISMIPKHPSHMSLRPTCLLLTNCNGWLTVVVYLFSGSLIDQHKG